MNYVARHLEFYMDLDHKRSYKCCIKTFLTY
jgi:hypothetical protein